MRIKSLLMSLLAVAVLAFTLHSFTIGRGWVKLGEKRVDYKIDHDVMNVSVRDGNFKQLRFAVREGSLNLYRCVIHFENGGTQEADLRFHFKRGSESKIIDLNGKNRFIEKISFWYDTKNASNNKAVLLVFGK
ncbi:MAG: hypothetical protein WKF35_03325 [Ferruginibacter sp.]